MVRRLIMPCLAALVLTACAHQSPPNQIPISSYSLPVPPSQQLGRLADEAAKLGTPTVGLLVTTAPGKAEETAAALRALGAEINSTDARIGYLRVTVPTAAVERAAALPTITAVDLETTVPHTLPPVTQN